MQIIDLFSGIGGFSVAGERAGFATVCFCEINKFCQQVLKKNFPNVPIYNDIRNLSFETIKNGGTWNPTRATMLVAGFP